MILYRNQVSGNINILLFMFPNLQLIDETNIPSYPDRPGVYIGAPEGQAAFIEAYNKTNLNYFIYSHTSEIDLNDRRVLAQIAFEKWRKGYLPKYLEAIIDQFDNETFMLNFKYKWVSGKWLDKRLNEENTFLELVESLNKSKYEFMQRYFEVIRDTRPYRIESSMMTFLQRAKYDTYRGSSFEYRAKLLTYKGDKLEKSLDAINKSLCYNIDNYELRLLNLLMNILDSGRS